jgi:hypothetical protein
MSSADLAHILTLWSNSFRLVCFTVFLPKKKQQVEHLLFCLFPSFKERVMLPFKASVWVSDLTRCWRYQPLFVLGVQR